MIEDLVVNLEQQAARDPARDFAISVAKTFGAHVAGVAFAFVSDFPGYIAPQLQPDMLALQRKGGSGRYSAPGRCRKRWHWTPSNGQVVSGARLILSNVRYSGRITHEIDPALDRHEVDDGAVLCRERLDVSSAVLVRFSERVLCALGREQDARLGKGDAAPLVRWQC